MKTSGASDEDRAGHGLRVVLVVEAAHGQMVHAATAAAGVQRGTRLTDARALDPGLQAVAADLAGDADLLARLARWASRWSPLVEVDGEDGLRMDVAGVAHLFGGEAGLCRDIEARFSAMGLTACVALAESAGAAWGLARFGGDRLPGKALADGSRPCRWRRCGWARDRRERWNCLASRPSARWPACRGAAWRGAFARPTIRSTRSIACLGARPNR